MTRASARVDGGPVPRVTAVLLGVGVAAMALAFVAVGILHKAPSAFYASATWGALLLASFSGWGATLDTLVFGRQRADWGLRCAWGWAIVVTMGGALFALHLAVRGALVALVALGLIGLAVDRVSDCRRSGRRAVRRALHTSLAHAGFTCGGAAVFALAAALYFASIVDGNFNGNDDLLCYFGFAREILDRGTISQPFSLRRIQVYGGKSLLDALQIAIPVPDLHLHLLDRGMALLTVLMLLVGHRRAAPRTSRAILLLLLFLTVTLPDIHINTTATMVGAAFFLGLYRTLVWRPIRERRRLRDAIPVALVAAATCTLRQNYLPVVGVLLALEFGTPIVRALRSPSPEERRAPVESAVATAAILFACLVPWWITSFASCRSFLFPIVRGTFNKEYDYFRPLGAFDALRYFWDNAAYCLPIKTVPLFLVAALTSLDRARDRTAIHFAVASLLGFAMLLVAYPSVDAPNLGRYYFGFTFPALLAIALAVADRAGQRRARSTARADSAVGPMLVVVAVAMQMYSEHDRVHREWNQYLSMIQPEFERPSPWRPPAPDPEYAGLQDEIPPGAAIAVMVDQFDRFDLRRNPIESLDMVGAVSPPPGLPLFGTADGVADYLIARGYRYLVVVRPDAAAWLYRRDVWQHLDPNTLDAYKRTARFYLRAFDVFDELRTTRRHLGDSAHMTALDLSLRTP